MPAKYSCSAPDVNKNEKDEVCVSHNHVIGISYNSFGWKKRKLVNEYIDDNSIKLKGCITFFRTVAEDKSVDVKTRAAAACAVAEDEALLADMEKNRRSTCVIL